MAEAKPARKKQTLPPSHQCRRATGRSPRTKSRSTTAGHHTTRAPGLGDKVTVGNSDTVYTVNRINPAGTQVDLHLEGTNIERFRVHVNDLNFVDRANRAPGKPPKPVIDVDDVHERLVTLVTTPV